MAQLAIAVGNTLTTATREALRRLNAQWQLRRLGRGRRARARGVLQSFERAEYLRDGPITVTDREIRGLDDGVDPERAWAVELEHVRMVEWRVDRNPLAQIPHGYASVAISTTVGDWQIAYDPIWERLFHSALG